jgi:hypothetical protein
MNEETNGFKYSSEAFDSIREDPRDKRRMSKHVTTYWSNQFP